MELTLLGTGDSTGTPTPGCCCETCVHARQEGYSRTRFSLHLHNPRTDETLLIDASPDFRAQLLPPELPLPDAIVITHIHFDHLDGLGNVNRLCQSLPVIASNEPDPYTGQSVSKTIRERYAYLDAVEVTPVEPYTTHTICGLAVELVPVTHPPMHSYGVVVTDPETGGQLSITGDTNWAIPERSLERLADPDLFLADAIVPASYCADHPAGGSHHMPDGTPRTFGTKHLTREGALELATRLDAGTTRLVHISHFYPVEEAFEEPLALDGESYQL